MQRARAHKGIRPREERRGGGRVGARGKAVGRSRGMGVGLVRVGGGVGQEGGTDASSHEPTIARGYTDPAAPRPAARRRLRVPTHGPQPASGPHAPSLLAVSLFASSGSFYRAVRPPPCQAAPPTPRHAPPAAPRPGPPTGSGSQLPPQTPHPPPRHPEPSPPPRPPPSMKK